MRFSYIRNNEQFAKSDSRSYPNCGVLPRIMQVDKLFNATSFCKYSNKHVGCSQYKVCMILSVASTVTFTFLLKLCINSLSINIAVDQNVLLTYSEGC